MTAKQVARWEKTRRKGRAHFIWFRGVLIWGGITGLLWTAVMAGIKGWPFLGMLPLSLVLFPIGGYFWGAWTWRLIEVRYAEATARIREPDGNATQ